MPTTFVVRRVESEFDKPQISGTYRTESSSLFFTSLPSLMIGGKTYEVTLTTGITDLAGNPLPSEVVRSFTTAP
ncbi:MAG: Ig-like domain-containing protein [Candidatus Manganitrophus sp.]|nr:Ig-like domain-containing protein [Candidatus Manganitrophus sp.]